jgi:DNA-binding transcriptional MerR regulator
VSGDLAIGEVAAQTGVPIATLRVWETRYGVPAPNRLASGHRRYSQRDVDVIKAALEARASGLSLPAALERARASAEAAPPASIYAGLRRERPGLQPIVFAKRALVAVAHAIEDECCSRATRPLLFGSFQRERFYRQAEPRWREFARTAERAVVFADFPRSNSRRTPAEVRVDRAGPLLREWAIVCDAPDAPACLAAWEIPGSGRRFETIWTTEPEAVRAAARIAWGLARLPGTPEAFGRPAIEQPGAARRVTELAGRMLAYAVT